MELAIIVSKTTTKISWNGISTLVIIIPKLTKCNLKFFHTKLKEAKKLGILTDGLDMPQHIEFFDDAFNEKKSTTCSEKVRCAGSG